MDTGQPRRRAARWRLLRRARRGTHRLSAGPYDDIRTALANVKRGSALAEKVQSSRAVFYAYGVSRLPMGTALQGTGQ
jgi:hypothetical protein